MNGPVLEDWLYVHNVIVPPAAMTTGEVLESSQRYLLDVAYRQDVLVACTTVRPPVDGSTTATVIVRVLPEHRRQGFGADLYTRAVALARARGAERIQTVVWASNVDGLRFAQARGFVEVSRFVPEDEDVPFLTLQLR